MFADFLRGRGREWFRYPCDARGDLLIQSNVMTFHNFHFRFSPLFKSGKPNNRRVAVGQLQNLLHQS